MEFSKADIIGIIVGIILVFGGFFGCGFYANRLERSMDECRQYREQLEAARNRESEIRNCISRTSVILSETGNEVANLRTKLEALEVCYYNMRNIIDGNDPDIDLEEMTYENISKVQ